ncbi:MAG: PH domain-containing protein [bacterium]|nr:PH domain-containing protein [bacterium]
MRRRLEELIKRLLKVPPEPEAPVGAPGSLRVFRAAPGFFSYRLLGWILRQAVLLLGVVALVGSRLFVEAGSIGNLRGILEGLAVAGFLSQMAFSFLMVSLDYQYRWYIVTDRSLRIREGLIRVRERTMTFSNIQNVSVRQGPLQRAFGISDLEVRTAGGGGGSGPGEQQKGLAENLHLGYFRGVDNPAEIRDTILSHLRRLRSAGLGDPDEVEAVPPEVDELAGAGELLAAGEQVLSEARALRSLVA